MTFYVENETEFEFDFDIEKLSTAVGEEILDTEKCPYSVQVNLLVTDDEGIREFNKNYRNIDKETDVLSFPNLSFEQCGVFDEDFIEENYADFSDPETEDLILGDIIINYKRVLSQADNYGHSIKREFGFLVAHSMLHLCGYDHETDSEAKVMEGKQEEALNKLGITRDIE